MLTLVVKALIDGVQRRNTKLDLDRQREREAEDRERERLAAVALREREAEDREDARVAVLEQIALGISINREAIHVANNANEKIAAVVEVATRVLSLDELTAEVRRIAGVSSFLLQETKAIRVLVEDRKRPGSG